MIFECCFRPDITDCGFLQLIVEKPTIPQTAGDRGYQSSPCFPSLRQAPGLAASNRFMTDRMELNGTET